MSPANPVGSDPDLWKEATDAFVDSGGVGIPGRFGVDLRAWANVPSAESAMVGD